MVRAQFLDKQSLFVRQKVPGLPGVGVANGFRIVTSQPSTVAISAPTSATLNIAFIVFTPVS